MVTHKRLILAIDVEETPELKGRCRILINLIFNINKSWIRPTGDTTLKKTHLVLYLHGGVERSAFLLKDWKKKENIKFKSYLIAITVENG